MAGGFLTTGPLGKLCIPCWCNLVSHQLIIFLIHLLIKKYIYIYLRVYMYIYIYYVYLCVYICVCVYIYIYIYTHMCLPGVVLLFPSLPWGLSEGAGPGWRSWIQVKPVCSGVTETEGTRFEWFSFQICRPPSAFCDAFITPLPLLPRNTWRFQGLLINCSKIILGKFLFSNQVSFNSILKFSS